MKEGFPFIADGNSKILILGSFPSSASLSNHEYYAHPRNAFWKIILTLFHYAKEKPFGYFEKIEILKRNGIALWDVLACCERKGSLDSAIEKASMVPNDFHTLEYFAPNIENVFFNGQSARAIYKKISAKFNPKPFINAEFHVLPSTSPANARMGLEEKILCWKVIRQYL